MRLTVDGRAVDVAEGASLLSAVSAVGVELPTLCHDERMTPAGSCRTCLVRVAGKVSAACVTPAAAGDLVETATDDLRSLRREAVELIVSALPPGAVDGTRSELARACRAMGIGVEAATGTGSRGRDATHPYVHLDADLCIACGRCVRMCSEVQGTFALTLTGRGADTVVAPGTGGSWAESDCVACGGCVDTCPTGAIVEPGHARGLTSIDPEAPSRTRTTCGYCGVGCTLQVATQDGKVTAVLPAREGPVNRGHACVKGRFAHGFLTSRERLTQPLVRRDGRLEPAGWDEALQRIAQGLQQAVAEGGPDAVAAISSARATNEENYLVQKLLRVAIGTNNVDNCSRLCHSPSAAGLTASFGLPGGTDSFDDVEKADSVLVVGANPVEAHPVVGARLLQSVLRGARLIVADPRLVGLAGHADVHVRPRPGTNVALFHGIAHVLVAEGMTDREFLERRSSGLPELLTLLEDYPPERVASITGIPSQDLVTAARLYGRAERPAIVYGLGVTEHLHGTDGVRALANLAILRGAVGTDRGFGVNPLRGQNNVQGASDMGALPDFLPGYGKVTDPAVRARAEQVWGVTVPERPGLRIPEMFAAARAGRLRALWIIGEDVCATDPDSNRVAAALEACPLVVCSELFLSGTARRADVVLPVASWLEKEGTFVNFDRRFQRVRAAVPPPGSARTDFEVVHAVAAALGKHLGCPTPADALEECGRIAPVFAGLSYERLEREVAVPWPCPDAARPGEAKLYRERFATPDGLAHLAAAPYLPPGEQPDGDYPLTLVTGRRWAHYNSGGMTRRTHNMRLASTDWLDVHPDDAARYGLRTGEPVTVQSRHGQARLRARVSGEPAPGQVFCAFHFPENGVNRLTSDHADTVTSCPEYKVTAVRVAPDVAGVTEGPVVAAAAGDTPEQ